MREETKHEKDDSFYREKERGITMESRVEGIILCMMGLVLSLNPTLIWKLTEKWKTEESKGPSARYRSVLRIVSGTFIGVGVLLAAGVLK